LCRRRQDEGEEKSRDDENERLGGTHGGMLPGNIEGFNAFGRSKGAGVEGAKRHSSSK
jgi:hypothetical protein